MHLESKNDRTILMYAFRYALGRTTYAVSDVVKLIGEGRDHFKDWERDKICKEILEYEEYHGTLGTDMETKMWYDLIVKLQG